MWRIHTRTISVRAMMSGGVADAEQCRTRSRNGRHTGGVCKRRMPKQTKLNRNCRNWNRHTVRVVVRRSMKIASWNAHAWNARMSLMPENKNRICR